MRFVKGHGTANDFVLLPDPEGALDLSDGQVAAICDRRRGVGGDGILRVVRTQHVPAAVGQDAEWFMDYRNADGGAVEMCGNGIRVFARYLAESGLADGPHLRIGTRDGVKLVRLLDDGEVSVDMGPPGLDPPTPAPDGATYVSMGNPHLVFGADDVASAPVETDGPALEAGWPGGANVEWFTVTPGRLRMRVWERGVGETMSCGTGACAVAVAANLRGLASRESEVELPGGRLHVAWTDDTVLLTGPAVLVAEGEIRSELLD